MSKADEIIEEIKKTLDKLEDYKPIQKIKMKEEFYNNLAREVQQEVSITEVLDEKRQPLNRICEVKIEIDNDIKKDYEVVYMNKKIKMIDLAINIANEEWNKVPSRIIFEGEDFVFDREEKKYKQVNEDYICLCFPTYKLNDEVEILEDNTEDIKNIEELYLEKVHTIPPSIFLEETFLLCEDKINELVKAIKQIRKDKNND